MNTQVDTPYDDKILRILTENLLPPVSKDAGFQKRQKWMTCLVQVCAGDTPFLPPQVRTLVGNTLILRILGQFHGIQYTTNGAECDRIRKYLQHKTMRPDMFRGALSLQTKQPYTNIHWKGVLSHGSVNHNIGKSPT